MSSNFVEITGQPCSGKSTFVSNCVANDEYGNLKINLFKKLIYFFKGIYSLGLKRSKILFIWSLAEEAPIIFRINIFRNAVTRFGIFYVLGSLISENSTKTIILDEGVSHLPFIFLKTDTKEVINFISNELKKINVFFISAPSSKIIKSRLIERGHKRLRFLSVNFFSERVFEIENILLSQYPSRCRNFEVLKC
tara:strand:+ start:39795 stop:40376 length:582 start_codon:yes stop_codon:yes gene_type:complete